MAESDIVVVGKRDSTGQIYDWTQLAPGRSYTPRMPDENGGGEDADYVDAIYVRVHVANNANKAAAIAAAQRLALAIARVKGLLQASPTITFTVKGVTYSIGDTLSNLERTSWFVSDTQNFNNNGVGSASYSVNGNNVDIIYFGSLGNDGYGSPNYTNYQGMTALILHELSHLSQAGYDFFNNSLEEYKKRNGGSSNGYYDSPFAKNVEAFANDIMIQISATIGADINDRNVPVIPGGFSNSVDPATIRFP